MTDEPRAGPPAADAPAAPFRITIISDSVFAVSGTPPPAAAALLPGTSWTDLLRVLNGRGTDRLTAPVEALLRRGEAFTCYVTCTDERRYRVSGSTSGLRALLEFTPLSGAEAQLLADLEQSEAARRRAERLLNGFAAAPVAAMVVDAAQEILWETGTARALAGRLREPEALFRPAAAAAPAALLDGSGERHLAVTAVALDDVGGRLLLVEDRSETVAARRTLASFMATMTETFAHLGTALAVFDGQQTLSLFNPCFTDLFGLDPAALAGRPTLRDLLDALRHARKLPEQANFTRWRDGFIDEVTAARDSPLVQDWYLPGGEILRMTARPHAGGAVVLLFEDISDHVSLERRYRVEIETGQSILDRLGEGVAVFSSSGQVVYCNPAFAEALGFDPFRSLLSGGLQTFVDHAASVFGAREQWQSFREFALGPDRARDWIRSMATPSGGTLWLRANPLPDGSTMLVVAWGPAQTAAAANDGEGDGAAVQDVGT